MAPVKHRPRGPGNPDASRCSSPARWVRVARTSADACASVASARRAPCARRGCAGSAVPPHAANPDVPRASRLGRSSADHGRSGCTAAPAPGSERTRTGGQDARPGARSSGRNPESAPRAQRARCRCSAVLDGLPRQCNTDAAPATPARCRARRGSKAAKRSEAAAVPTYSGLDDPSTATSEGLSSTRGAGSSSRPACRVLLVRITAKAPTRAPGRPRLLGCPAGQPSRRVDAQLMFIEDPLPHSTADYRIATSHPNKRGS